VDEISPPVCHAEISKLIVIGILDTMRTSRHLRLLLTLALALALTGCAGKRWPKVTVDDLTWNSLGWESLYYVGGGRYEGKFDRGFNRNGPGTYTFPNGDRLTATFRDGVVISRATVYFADGKKYVGEFRDNRMTGQGTLFLLNGDRYDGDFVQGRRHGRGVYTFITGGQYTGTFLNDQITGFGTFVYVNGDRYTGQVLNGQHQGVGRLDYADDRIPLEGRWDRGEFVWPQKIKNF
jgi:hypothetical protein